jgi:hypothetical protein
MHSVLFDHHLERVGGGPQCRVIQECFDAHVQRCHGQFTAKQVGFMRVLCLSSALHASESTISSARTRGLLMLLFMRLWPLRQPEKEVILNVKQTLSHFGLRDRLYIYAKVAVNTSIMELAAWLGLLLYAHTMLVNGAVTATWSGVYDEMLRMSKFSSWNVSRGQDPRYLNDLIFLMSHALLSCLALCSMFPVPFSASFILLLPVTLIVQVRTPQPLHPSNSFLANTACSVTSHHACRSPS